MAKVNSHEIAQEFLAQDKRFSELVFSERYENFLMWRGVYYSFLEGIHWEREIFNFMLQHFPKINITQQVGEVIKSLRWLCPNTIYEDTFGYIAFNDGYFSTETFELSATDKNKHVTFYVPYSYENDVKDSPIPPNFKRFLESTLVHKTRPKETDRELLALIQEIFGYYLMNSDLKAAATFFFVGTGANGKTILLEILRALFDPRYVTSMSIQKLTTDKWATAHLVGKLINISNEEESKYLRTDTFKHLIDGNNITAERKYGGNFEFKPRTKYIFASNKLPTFENVDYAMKRRFHIIPFYRRFSFGDIDRDPHILEKIIPNEIPGIINWALEGAKRLIKNKYIFSRSMASELEFYDFETSISSSLMFFREHYEVDNSDNAFIAFSELYNRYSNWCSDNGKKPLSSTNFKRELKNNIDGMYELIGNNRDGRSARGFKIVEIDKAEQDGIRQSFGVDNNIPVDKINF